MPKIKKKAKSSSNSDSDSSGPDDRNPPPAKQSKQSDKNKTDEENCWTLEKLRMVKVREFKGKKMIDIREHYEKNAEILPGKKGISLSPLQWKKLLEVADEINAALK